jgi:amidase
LADQGEAAMKSLRIALVACTIVCSWELPARGLPLQGAAEVEGATLQVRQSLRRIKQFDQQYRAVIAVDAKAALTDAAQQDALTAADRDALPLAGTVVLLKDNIEMRGLPTTAGSLALAGHRSGRDAALVAQLRSAGALLLGKTNLSEWANFRSEHSISGWSAVGGQTRNAVDRQRSPCGSSSGSAVAVALGYVPVAIGTETDGSIVCPAAVNGVVGFKPSKGLVSTAGIIPLAASQDTAGPIAASVAQASLALSAMADRGNADAETIVAGLRDYAGLHDLRGVRIGVLQNSLGYRGRRDAALTTVLKMAETAGAVLVSGLVLAPYPAFDDDSYSVLLYEFRRDIADYFAGLSNTYRDWDLARLIAFNEDHAPLELAYFDQGIFERSQQLALTEAQYLSALARIRQATREDGLDRLFGDHQLDVIAGITVGPAWVIDKVNGDAFFGPGVSSYPAIAGNPHITLPLTTVAGLPVGISLVGQRYADHRLAQIAYRLEQVFLEQDAIAQPVAGQHHHPVVNSDN